ncbi:lamin tail domain-containing protein 1 isoform X3 [Phascolarctos cinereus]|uniref:Lamin tail domain-containing protein 1 isoform X2 n=1 Tax=Phascolarctos cinereus TaxID=38626 RepID=A0A6P5IQ07_PHACI|nr:lamin tail domain-containing protein 1 isoform X2 [Phascolarctos cinereus]XP_020820699.1 lamin tail domain-containing protein 1 isoform X2 [Phascolarctos cinereus]
MKEEKIPQENLTVLQSEVCLQSKVYDLRGQPKEENGNEEKHLHGADWRQQSLIHFSSPYSSEPSNHSITLKKYVSSSLNTGLTSSSVAPKSSSSSTNFNRIDNTSSSSPSVSVLQKPRFAVLTPPPTVLGDGEDYFHSLFFNSKRRLTHPEFPDRTKTLFPDDLADISNSSALGDIKIVEVSGNGLFVKIINSSPDKELMIGDHILQQNVNGHAVSLYKFHPNIRMPANAAVTVWAASSEVKHQPPSDFLWKEQDKFRTSLNCITILCKPNGEAIAWYTPIHWKRAWEGFDTDKKYTRSPLAISSPGVQMNRAPSTVIKIKQDQQTTTKLEEQVHVFLKREKEIPPTLFPNRNPWGLSCNCPVHPNYSLFRPITVGNDGITLCRQSRLQSARPDPIPAPYSLSVGTRRNKTTNASHLNHKSSRKSASSPEDGRKVKRPIRKRFKLSV